MIKAVATDKDGVKLFVFGLSDGNIERLREGKPILVELAPLGGEGRVAIFWGETEEAMAADILKTFPGTPVK